MHYLTDKEEQEYAETIVGHLEVSIFQRTDNIDLLATEAVKVYTNRRVALYEHGDYDSNSITDTYHTVVRPINRSITPSVSQKIKDVILLKKLDSIL